jgi:hypothetical protein
MLIVLEEAANPFLGIYSATLVAFVAGAFSLLGLTVYANQVRCDGIL